jgi:hypothetical protein
MLAYAVIAIGCGIGAARTQGWARVGLLVPTVVFGVAVVWTAGVLGVLVAVLRLAERRFGDHTDDDPG